MSDRRAAVAASDQAGWVPFLCALAAIAALAGSAITWVTSPNWGGHHAAQADARNIGQVPTAPGALAAFVSPDQIEIPRLAARAPIVTVRTLSTGVLDVPLNPRTVGWWNGGAKPGAKKGTAILDGHINYNGVDGVLSRIGTLDPGDTVYIDGLHNGHRTRVKFSITGVRTYEKKALPYREIFDQKSVGRLAIVTCGGPFNAHTGNYLDNIVAFAVPA
jgi:sortase family protein